MSVSNAQRGYFGYLTVGLTGLFQTHVSMERVTHSIATEFTWHKELDLPMVILCVSDCNTVIIRSRFQTRDAILVQITTITFRTSANVAFGSL